MNSREVVLTSLAFERPPRIPFGMTGGFPSDLRFVKRTPATNSRMRPWKDEGDYWERIDEWGNAWRRLEPFSKGEVHRGVLQDDWDLLSQYEFPENNDSRFYECARHETREHHRDGYFVLGLMGWPFDIARYMRRFDNFLADIIESPDQVQDLLWRVTSHLEVELLHLADCGVDGVFAGEDWGMQDRLLIHPDCWRAMFKPCWKRLCDAAHSRNLSVWIHSCGYVKELLTDWHEVGVNVCQFDQPELHGIDFLSERFGGRLHFWCPVDIQSTLQTRDKGKIEAAAREYIEKLGRFGGGFIAGYYDGNEALGLTPEYQATASEAFMRFGDPAPRAAAG